MMIMLPYTSEKILSYLYTRAQIGHLFSDALVSMAAAAFQGVIEYGTAKDYVVLSQLVRILQARGFKREFRTTRASVPVLRELIGSDHRVRLVLNGSQYRLRGVKFTDAVLHPMGGLLQPSISEASIDTAAACGAETPLT
mmetsp:Transcript_28041/g.90662  ORF Transcript_28041/g.90662 Transcript_28041/m.90662 type:complete len:140 (+) Transcript_28041:44-463(+)